MVCLLLKSCLSYLQHSFHGESGLLPFRLGPWGIPCTFPGWGVGGRLSGPARNTLLMWCLLRGWLPDHSWSRPWGIDPTSISANLLNSGKHRVFVPNRTQVHGRRRTSVHLSSVPGTPSPWYWGWVRQGWGTDSRLHPEVSYIHPRNIGTVVFYLQS